jgi:hypothetical protein
MAPFLFSSSCLLIRHSYRLTPVSGAVRLGWVRFVRCWNAWDVRCLGWFWLLLLCGGLVLDSPPPFPFLPLFSFLLLGLFLFSLDKIESCFVGNDQQLRFFSPSQKNKTKIDRKTATQVDYSPLRQDVCVCFRSREEEMLDDNGDEQRR